MRCEITNFFVYRKYHDNSSVAEIITSGLQAERQTSANDCNRFRAGIQWLFGRYLEENPEVTKRNSTPLRTVNEGLGENIRVPLARNAVPKHGSAVSTGAISQLAPFAGSCQSLLPSPYIGNYRMDFRPGILLPGLSGNGNFKLQEAMLLLWS